MASIKNIIYFLSNYQKLTINFDEDCRYGHVLTQEEIEQYAETEVPETPPTLEQFKEQIDSYEKTYGEIESMNSSVVFDNWLRIDARPFKQALLNEIKKWSFMLKQHLIDNVTNRYVSKQNYFLGG